MTAQVYGIRSRIPLRSMEGLFISMPTFLIETATTTTKKRSSKVPGSTKIMSVGLWSTEIIWNMGPGLRNMRK